MFDTKNPAKRAAREFEILMERIMQGSTEIKFSQLPKEEQDEFKRRQRELHPSGFPYCGLRDGYEKMLRAHTDFPVYRSFGQDYILGNGTLIHRVMQQWMGAGAKIYGRWKCMDCKHVHKNKPKPKNGECKKCGSINLEYNEIGGRYKKWVSWHSDGLWRDPRGKFWVIDYKSTSVSRIEQHKQDGNIFPYASNRIQIESYVLLLERYLNIKIEGWMLVYVARDFPQYKKIIVSSLMEDERREVVDKHMNRSIKIFPLTLEKPTSETFNTLREYKLCVNRDYYETRVKDEYNECPLAASCFKRTKLDSVLEGEMKNYRKRAKATA